MNGEELQALLDDHFMFHSPFQIERFILAKEGGTPYGCYKQALRELSKRYRALKQIVIDRGMLLVDIDQLEAMIQANEQTGFELCRKELRLTQKRMELDDVERVLKDTSREFAHFYGQAEALKAMLPELTPDKRDELDREMWEHHLKSRIALELLSVGHVREETIATVQSGPKEWRVELHNALNVVNGDRVKQHEIVEWYLGLEPVVVEVKELIEPEQVMKLLE